MSLPKWLVWLGCVMLLLVPAIGGPAATSAALHEPSAGGLLEVKHQVQGNDVLIECFAAQFPFRKGNGGGHINVYVNEQKVTEVYTAAFIVRGLPSGKHVIRLELVYNDGKVTGMTHEFDVDIP
ncbi:MULTISPECIES: hypothetical protein [Geobacillus]|jgi:hypothetical protein|uniref:Uncharacterized protein n=2 Tax=Geobacillus thermodenitrificans TaxID=33940 RepID=A4ILY3_GEOTN|nr:MULTISPECIES: hypothetical protein [Geobacillus]ABO66337.1 Conserved hypothetical protein [Geobacillus thermodenitrificans NG80-2]ARA97268.1 hypothetical protein GD3902_03910 [Geobacillus thermodenitrificans]ARP42093.1 hypothetical protein GTHT12_00531 [Geobacillus thermodenitrificans]ATO36565.1 hypothetical protein GTID1_04610 [Geobacillus thermodenitrificans]KQB93976.1 hypothetical protein GEPA3_1024 [Geobacillus sp. PA-3]